MVVVVLAHPYLDRSRANRALVGAVQDLPGVAVRALYELYPDFAIDVEAEQAALSEAASIVWQHPIYWYTVPGLMKHWFDKVLARGWAYGQGGSALRGKRCLWVVTTGGDTHTFSAEGAHGHEFSAFSPVVEQTARFCGMQWETPFVLHRAHGISDAELDAAVDTYRGRLRALLGEGPPGDE